MTEYKPQDYSKYRLRKARETILEVDYLIQNQFWNTAVNVNIMQVSADYSTAFLRCNTANSSLTI